MQLVGQVHLTVFGPLDVDDVMPFARRTLVPQARQSRARGRGPCGRIEVDASPGPAARGCSHPFPSQSPREAR